MCESRFLEASPLKPFYFTPFGRKRLQTAPRAGGEALPNGALIVLVISSIPKKISDLIVRGISDF
jgi:hypothetical protein